MKRLFVSVAAILWVAACTSTQDKAVATPYTGGTNGQAAVAEEIQQLQRKNAALIAECEEAQVEIPKLLEASPEESAAESMEDKRDRLQVNAGILMAGCHSPKVTTSSGLVYQVVRTGDLSRRPSMHDTVKVHYEMWMEDGTLKDSSRKRGTPAEFPLQSVIPGWTEGLQLMGVGGVSKFWIPESLGYKGAAGKPGGVLYFEVELLDIL